MAVPILTVLDPSATASGQSPLIPIESVSKPRNPSDASPAMRL